MARGDAWRLCMSWTRPTGAWTSRGSTECRLSVDVSGRGPELTCSTVSAAGGGASSLYSLRSKSASSWSASRCSSTSRHRSDSSSVERAGREDDDAVEVKACTGMWCTIRVVTSSCSTTEFDDRRISGRPALFMRCSTGRLPCVRITVVVSMLDALKAEACVKIVVSRKA